MMSLCFEYLYRDSGNYKNWGEVVFSNVNNYEISELVELIRKSLIDREFFVVENCGIPALYFEPYNRDLDHDWHEFSSLNLCDMEVTDIAKRDITEFIKVINCTSVFL